MSTPASSADPDPTASADGTGRRCQPFADMVPTELGSFGGATMPSDINDHGQVVGVSFTPAGQTHAFLWESGVLTDLTPSLHAAQDPDINERGQILIHASGAEGSRTLLWHRGTSVELNGLAEHDRGVALNDRGQVAIQGYDRIALWEDGALTPIVEESPPTINALQFVDLGEGGHVLGYGLSSTSTGGVKVSPFVWHDGALTWLPVPDPTSETEPFVSPYPVAVDRFGRVLLNAYRQDDDRPYVGAALLWTGDRYLDLGSLAPGSTPEPTVALDMSDRGEVVGTAVAVPGRPLRAFSWRRGRMTDLGTPVPGQDASARHVSERGHVAGYSASETGMEDAAFAWWCGTTQVIGPYAAAADFPVGINDRGQVISIASTADMLSLGVLWTPTRR